MANAFVDEHALVAPPTIEVYTPARRNVNRAANKSLGRKLGRAIGGEGGGRGISG